MWRSGAFCWVCSHIRARKVRRGRVRDPTSVPSGRYMKASDVRVSSETRWLGGAGGFWGGRGGLARGVKAYLNGIPTWWGYIKVRVDRARRDAYVSVVEEDVGGVRSVDGEVLS